MTTQQLKTMYDTLKKGYNWHPNCTDFHGICYRANGNLFCFNHYGSSAVSATLSDLKWLVEKIFDNLPFDKWICNNEFVYC